MNLLEFDDENKEFGLMDNKRLFRRLLGFLVAAALFGAGCSGTGAAAQPQSGGGYSTSVPTGKAWSKVPDNSGGDTVAAGSRDSTPVVLEARADGSVTYGNELVTIDASHSDNGYVMIKYNGTNDMVKIVITVPGYDKDYQYTSRSSDFETFPLTGGSGTYKIIVYESVSVEEKKYSPIYKLETEFTITDEFAPFLYPNQYVNFTKDSQAVKKGAQLAASADTDLDVVAGVYHYLVDNVIYDTDKAKDVEDKKIKLYLPVPDDTLDSGTGICFDYAALMTTMLRSQRIPTKLVTGYAGTVFHAWISTYITDIGWIDNIIEFDGKTWTMMDPTFAASGKGSKDTERFISDGSNYTPSYCY